MVRRAIFIFFTIIFTGCVGTLSGAYRVFAEDLERLVGKEFKDAYVYNIGHLAELKPDAMKELKNGNKIYLFSVKPPRKQECSVHIEKSKNDIILSASSSGAECWRAY